MPASEQRPRILVAGFDRPDNPFARQIDKLGAEAVWYCGRLKSERLDLNCDAAVLAISHVGHEPMWAVKKAYRDKALFIAKRAWSEVREQVEELITAKEKAMAFNTPKIVEDKQPKRMRNSEEDAASVRKVVSDCMSAKMSIDETVEMLAAEKLTKGSGEPFKKGDIYSLQATVKRHAAEQGLPLPAAPRKIKREVGIVLRATPPPAAVQVIPPQAKMADLIETVMATGSISDREKLDLIRKITAGDIETPDVLDVQVLAGPDGRPTLRLSHWHITRPGQNLAMNLSKAQAELILRASDQIMKFATEGKI